MPAESNLKISKWLSIPSIRHCIMGVAVILSSISFECKQWNTSYFAICYGITIIFILEAIKRHIIEVPNKLKLLSGISSIVFAFISTVGERYCKNQDWLLFFPTTVSIIRGIIQFLCLAFVFYNVILYIYCFFEKSNISDDTQFNLKKWGKIILTVKIIFFIAFYPCAFDFDSATGLRTFLDSNSATCNHHPVFVQVIHTIGLLLGKISGISSLGFALITLFFIFISTKILVYGLHLLIKWGIPNKWVRVSAFLYAFFPLFPYLSVNISKDGLFAYFFLYYLFNLFDIIHSQGQCLKSSKFSVLHSIVILLLCLTRHQGLYIVLVETFALFLICKGHRKILSYVICFPIICFLFWAKIVLPHFNVEPGGKQEAFGLFFQQTAYYLIENPRDITEEEKKTIDAILNYDSLSYLYKSYIQDPVKRNYKYNPWYRAYFKGPSMFRHIEKKNENQDLIAYMAVWAKMGSRHPLSYLKATFANSIGFFYNEDRPLISTEPYWSQNRSAASDIVQFFHFNKVSEFYYKNINKWLKFPFICWLLAIPYYNWIVIIMLSLLVYRKDWHGLSIFIPIIISILILFICPVAYGRYTYPIVISIPFLFSYLKKQQ